MEYAGYAYLVKHTPVQAPMPSTVVEIRGVTRKEEAPGRIMVPAKTAPEDGDILGHIVFALRYESINLQVLSQALPMVAEPEIREHFDDSPNSRYLRIACYLWEYFSGSTIQRRDERLRQNFTRIFDPEAYHTGPAQVNYRWRVIFNGIGSLDYCATVRRTDKLESLLQKNLLRKASEFTRQLPEDILNRTLSWAYLSETRDSFAIEKDSADHTRAGRFVRILEQAHEGIEIGEDFLCDLQKTVINNQFLKATSYRNEQNFLGSAQRGVLGISYVPPDHSLARELMDHICNLANNPPPEVDPVVLAGVVSFGFVFIHPFMDGNGRLSRFLFHQVLCRAGALKDGLILPVSTVLYQNEREYVATLKQYSSVIPQFWKVTEIEDDQFDFNFLGDSAIYRYWDATAACEFLAACSETAIEQHLKEETVYLDRYDAIYRRIDKSFDVAAKDLALLVRLCMEQKGRISNNRRKQYQYQVPQEVFDALEQVYAEVVEH